MKVIVDGLGTEYWDEGSGEVVLMLHGWGDSLHSFDELVERLKGDYRIIRVDFPGFGKSELPKGIWDVAKYTRFVSDFCKKEGIEPVYIIGHSFGGRILVKGLSSGTLTARKAVLMGSAGVADRKTLRNDTFILISKIGKLLLRPFPRVWYLRLRKELYRVTGGDYISAGALSDTFVRVINEDLSRDAALVSIPTLLIWGEDDLVTPISEGKKLKRLIRESELHVLTHSGHFVHQQRPDDVARLIKEFCV